MELTLAIASRQLWGGIVALGGVAVSYERGTRVHGVYRSTTRWTAEGSLGPDSGVLRHQICTT